MNSSNNSNNQPKSNTTSTQRKKKPQAAKSTASQQGFPVSQPQPKRQKTSNGGASTAPQNQQQEKQSPSSQYDSIHRERFLFLFLNFVGQLVEVHVTTGHVFEGIFSTISIAEQTEKKKKQDSYVVLKWARIKKVYPTAPLKPKRKDSGKNENPVEVMTIAGKDIVQIRAVDITFATEKQQYRDESFVTDTEISRRDFKERELVPWMSDNASESLESLDDFAPSTRSGQYFDQYDVNYNLFGVTSTYDEALYTTELDKNSEFYKQKSKEAERIAKEIERSASATNNVHLLEERGFDLGDVDEEDLYSSVIRPAPNLPNSANKKYVPPQQRPASKSEAPKPVHTKQTKQQSDEQSKTTSTPKSKEEKEQTDEKPALDDKDKKKHQLNLSITTHSRDRADSVGSFPARLLPPAVNVATRTHRSSSFSVGANIPSPTGNDSLFKERLRIRQLMTGSPSMSPISRSPLPSPLSPSMKGTKLASPFIGDATKIEALSLDPAKPKISEDIAAEFLKFSLTSKKTDDKKRAEINAFLDFSKGLSVRIKEPAPSTTGTATATVTTTTPPKRKPLLSMLQDKNKQAASAVSDNAVPESKGKAEKSETEPKKTPTKPATEQKQPETKETTSKETTKPVSAKPKETTKEPKESTGATKKSTLNPKAKAFVPGVGSGMMTTSFVPPSWPKPQPIIPTPTPTPVTTSWSTPKVDPNTTIPNVYLNGMKKLAAEKPDTTKVSHLWPNGKRASFRNLEENLSELQPQVVPMQMPPHFMPYPPNQFVPYPTGPGPRMQPSPAANFAYTQPRGMPGFVYQPPMMGFPQPQFSQGYPPQYNSPNTPPQGTTSPPNVGSRHGQ